MGALVRYELAAMSNKCSHGKLFSEECTKCALVSLKDTERFVRKLLRQIERARRTLTKVQK